MGWVAGSTGLSFKCDPAKSPTAAGQRCFSKVKGHLDGKAGFAVDAEGLVQVSRAVAASPVRLRLISSGRARVTINGEQVAALTTPAGTQREWAVCGGGTALHCTALHCAALRCAALRCAALRCAALQPWLALQTPSREDLSSRHWLSCPASLPPWMAA